MTKPSRKMAALKAITHMTPRIHPRGFSPSRNESISGEKDWTGGCSRTSAVAEERVGTIEYVRLGEAGIEAPSDRTLLRALTVMTTPSRVAIDESLSRL